MAPVRVHLFGSPVVFRGDDAIEVPRQKSLALIAVVALADAAESRASIGALLWPSLGEARALAALRSALWDLRQILGEEGLRVSRTEIACTPEIEVDVRTFASTLAAAHEAERSGDVEDAIAALERAVASYRGDFLQGLSLRDHEAFCAWRATHAERLRAARWTALEKLVDLLAQAGDTPRALAHAERMLSIAPADLAVHRRLIEMHLQRSDRAAALDQYARCVRVLAERKQQPDDALRALLSLASGKAASVWGAEPVRTPARSALPLSPTPLVGRERELQFVVDRLRDPEARLLTITGPGGVGKTRLAIEAAHRTASELEGGARLVTLANVSSTEGLAVAVLDACGEARGGAGEDPSRVIEALGSKSLLLVLDGFEHLLPSAVLIAELTAACPGVRVLVTSRERMHLRGEWEVPLDGLLWESADRGAAGRAPAIELFDRCGARAKPGFSLRREDEATAAKICALLAGIPLGIELAGAWVRHLDVDEIARRIEEDLDFLTAPRDAPSGHASLRATFARSWSLLSPDEQASLRQLSVLRGPFDLDAARAVAGLSSADLAALADKFLLQRASGQRHVLHSIIRRYTSAELASHKDEERAAVERHRAYFVGLCASLSSDVAGAAAVALGRRIDESCEDIRAAIASALQQGSWGEVDRALHGMVTAMEVHGRWSLAELVLGEIAAALRRALEAATRGKALLRRLLGRVLARQARVGIESLPRARVTHLLEESIALLRRADATADLCYACNTAGRMASRDGDLTLARKWFREALALRRKEGDRRGIAIAYNNLAVIASTAGDHARAERLLRKSLRAFRAIDDRRNIVAGLSSLGEMLLLRGDLDGAEAALREGLDLGREAGDRYSVAMLHALLGKVLLGAEKVALAEESYKESLAIGRAAGLDEAVATALVGLGTALRRRGELDLAQTALEEGLGLWQKLGGRIAIASAEAEIGLVWAQRRRPFEARAALLRALRRASALGVEPLLLDVLVSIAEARAFGAAHAAESAQIVASHPSASLETKRRAQKISVGTSADRREPTTLNDVVEAMLATA